MSKEEGRRTDGIKYSLLQARLRRQCPVNELLLHHNAVVLAETGWGMIVDAGRCRLSTTYPDRIVAVV